MMTVGRKWSGRSRLCSTISPLGGLAKFRARDAQRAGARFMLRPCGHWSRKIANVKQSRRAGANTSSAFGPNWRGTEVRGTEDSKPVRPESSGARSNGFDGLRALPQLDPRDSELAVLPKALATLQDLIEGQIAIAIDKLKRKIGDRRRTPSCA